MPRALFLLFPLLLFACQDSDDDADTGPQIVLPDTGPAEDAAVDPDADEDAGFWIRNRVTCGDGECMGAESQASCCVDCGCGTGFQCVDDKCVVAEGCGGECGQCGNGTVCDNGQCLTTNFCGDGYCDEAEGEDCNTCAKDCACELGKGLVCLPDGTCCDGKCAGKVCGDDGCGGSCGTCPVGHPCSPDGTKCGG